MNVNYLANIAICLVIGIPILCIVSAISSYQMGHGVGIFLSSVTAILTLGLYSIMVVVGKLITDVNGILKDVIEMQKSFTRLANAASTAINKINDSSISNDVSNDVSNDISNDISNDDLDVDGFELVRITLEADDKEGIISEINKQVEAGIIPVEVAEELKEQINRDFEGIIKQGGVHIDVYDTDVTGTDDNVEGNSKIDIE